VMDAPSPIALRAERACERREPRDGGSVRLLGAPEINEAG
jgi:hypothetical protein